MATCGGSTQAQQPESTVQSTRSPFFKDSGYYYTDKNIFEGVNQLEMALKDWKAIDNSDIIEKYNPDNSGGL